MDQHVDYELDELDSGSPHFQSSDMDLSLNDPRTRLTTQESVQEDPAGELPAYSRELWQKARPIRDLLLTFTISLVFAVLYILFISYVLIQGTPQVGSVFFDASITNLLVAIFSQISATLSDIMIRGLLSALRLAFAARNDSISAPTFLGLGPAAGWLQVLKLAMANKLFNVWCDFSGAAPRLNVRTNFDYYFIPGSTHVQVFAGLVPIDLRVLDLVSASDQCQYLQSWSASLLTNTKYAIGTSLDGCDNGCQSFLLPGGLELTRQFAPSLNYSIFYNGSLDDAESIRIENAPGFIAVFQTPESKPVFDPLVECVFGGKAINDSLQICVRQVNDSIAVGWAACPQDLFNLNECNTNFTWTSGPMEWSTVMSLYRQFTTTTYNRQNLSMVDTQTTSEPELMLLNASEYTTILSHVLVPNINSTQSDNSSINALTYALTWMHRTYAEVFPSDNTSLITNLYNFLVIPQLFMVTAVQVSNYTVSESGLQSKLGNFSLPDDMITTATGGWSNSRLAILPWTGYLFIAGDVTVLLFVLGGIVWILLQPHQLCSSTGVEELDFLRYAKTARCVRRLWRSGKKANTEPSEDAKDELTLIELANDLSVSKSLKRLREWRIKVILDAKQSTSSATTILRRRRKVRTH